MKLIQQDAQRVKVLSATQAWGHEFDPQNPCKGGGVLHKITLRLHMCSVACAHPYNSNQYIL